MSGPRAPKQASAPVLYLEVLRVGVTYSSFPGPADDFVEGQIDLNRELVPSPMSTTHITVVGDAMSGTGLYDGDLVLFDRAKLPGPGRRVVAPYKNSLTKKGGTNFIKIKRAANAAETIVNSIPRH